IAPRTLNDATGSSISNFKCTCRPAARLTDGASTNRVGAKYFARKARAALIWFSVGRMSLANLVISRGTGLRFFLSLSTSRDMKVERAKRLPADLILRESRRGFAGESSLYRA